MHIALDARRYDSGMWIYLSGLIDQLQAIDRHNKYTLIINEEKRTCFNIANPNFHVWLTSLTIENHWRGEIMRHLIMPRKLQAMGVEVFHDPGYFLPLMGKKLHKVVTFHDMVPFLHKETNSHKYFTYMRSVIRVSARIADMIIAVSENTRRDIINILQVPEESVRVTHEAAREIFRPIADRDKVAAVYHKLGIDRPYILNVGTIEPRKNIPQLLTAFNHLKQQYKIPHKLVIIGNMGWLYKPVVQKINKMGPESGVILTGYVEDDDLVALYNGAELFIFPSLYEGFGLPPLEALACGTPVASSQTSCLPEILGDAAVYFDPKDVDSIAASILSIIEHPELANSLRAKGPQQAAKFSWHNTAQKTREIYEELARRR